MSSWKFCTVRADSHVSVEEGQLPTPLQNPFWGVCRTGACWPGQAGWVEEAQENLGLGLRSDSLVPRHSLPCPRLPVMPAVPGPCPLGSQGSFQWSLLPATVPLRGMCGSDGVEVTGQLSPRRA